LELEYNGIHAKPYISSLPCFMLQKDKPHFLKQSEVPQNVYFHIEFSIYMQLIFCLNGK